MARFHINFSQTTRMYSLFALLTLLSFYLLVGVVERPTRRTVAGYALTTVLLVCTHSFALFVVLAQNVFVVGSGWLDGTDQPVIPLRTWVGSQVVLVSQPSYASPFEDCFSREAVAVKPLPASAAEIRDAVRGHDTAWLVTSHVPPDALRRYRDTLEAERSDADVTKFKGLTLWRFGPGNRWRANATAGRG